jgi:hypothetical protein
MKAVAEVDSAEGKSSENHKEIELVQPLNQSNHIDHPMNSQQSDSKKRTIEQISQSVPETAAVQNGEKRLKVDEASLQSHHEQVPMQASQGAEKQSNVSV